jgi:outer membrane protein assembly factor BamB
MSRRTPSVPWAAPALACAALACLQAQAAPPSRPYDGNPIDVLTYHYDNARTGGNTQETDLTVASVSSSSFGQVASLSVQGSVLAQPLILSNFTLPDNSVHNVVVAVTTTNDVYAIDPDSTETLWHVNLGTPQNGDDMKCSKKPGLAWGISATPVISRTGPGRATLYVVASTENAPQEFHSTLHALDMADGSDLHRPVNITARSIQSDGKTLKPSSVHQYVRAGLAYANGNIYVTFTSRCEGQTEDHITGWILGYDARLKQQGVFSTISSDPTGLKLGSVWGAGFAPAIDTDGSVIAVTGNGDFSPAEKDWGESVLRLDPALGQVLDYFTPANFDFLNGADLDFGSGGVLLVPTADAPNAPPLAVAMGKVHDLYLLDRSNLGHEQAGDAGALQSQQFDGEGVWGGPAYWRGPNGPLVYYQSRGDVMRAYALDTTGNPKLTEVAQGTEPEQISLPTVSSNGATAGTGIVWAINHATFKAYDAQSLQAPIFETTIPPFTGGSAFVTPVVANGRVYVGTAGAVLVFGLTN